MVIFFVLISDIEICYSLWLSHNFLLMLYIMSVFNFYLEFRRFLNNLI